MCGQEMYICYNFDKFSNFLIIKYNFKHIYFIFICNNCVTLLNNGEVFSYRVILARIIEF